MLDLAHVGVEALLLALSLALSSAVGLERQHRLKSAGVRTHALVGIGSTTFTLVSAYGFSSVLGDDVVLDPSRITAQIVSGVGFLGAGLIFVRRDAGVTGLTTAASIWVTAAIGMACGAGLPLLAVMTTAVHLFAVVVVGRVGPRAAPRPRPVTVTLRYETPARRLRTILETAAALDFEARLTRVARVSRDDGSPLYESTVRFVGDGPADELVDELASLKRVVSVTVRDAES